MQLFPFSALNALSFSDSIGNAVKDAKRKVSGGMRDAQERADSVADVAGSAKDSDLWSIFGNVALVIFIFLAAMAVIIFLLAFFRRN